MPTTEPSPDGLVDGPGSRPPWHGVEVRHLAALAAVARERSFREAAESLGYVQSAVSQQLARLEELVGARLVERCRGTGPVTLTEAGRQLLRHFDEISLRLTAAQADIEALTAGRSGPLAVGVFESAGASLMPSLLGALREEAPDVRVRMEEALTPDRLPALVESGELDLAFGCLPLPAGPFAHQGLLSDPYVLLVAAGSELASTPAHQLADQLADLPLIGPRSERAAATLEATLLARGIELRYELRSDSSATVRALVAAGVGCAIVPGLSVDQADHGTVAVALDPAVLPARRIVLYWHRERSGPATRGVFVRLARERCQGERRPSPT